MTPTTKIATTTETASPFPPFDYPMSETEILRLLKSPETAMKFALCHMEPFEVAMFIKDWLDGADMEPWLGGWRDEKEYGPRFA